MCNCIARLHISDKVQIPINDEDTPRCEEFPNSNLSKEKTRQNRIIQNNFHPKCFPEPIFHFVKAGQNLNL